MAESGTATVLKRKAEHGRASLDRPRGGAEPARALQDAFRRAAEEELKTTVLAGEPRERRANPVELVESLPDQAFLGILLGPEEGVGLFCLDPTALAAVIEMRTMGRIGKHSQPPRRTTRADAAMAIDLIDRVLAEFEAPLLETEAARWASGWRYQLFLPDPRPLPVVLEECIYRVLETEIVFGSGEKEGKVLIAVPATGRAQPRPPPEPPSESLAARAAEAWARSMHAAVASAEVTLDVVLGRLRLPLEDLAGLSPGDRIVLPLSALGTVRLMAPGAEAVAEGRLGQAGGLRAIRIADPSLRPAPLSADGTVLPAGTLHRTRPPGPAVDLEPPPAFAPASPAGAMTEPLAGGPQEPGPLAKEPAVGERHSAEPGLVEPPGGLPAL